MGWRQLFQPAALVAVGAGLFIAEPWTLKPQPEPAFRRAPEYVECLARHASIGICDVMMTSLGKAEEVSLYYEQECRKLTAAGDRSGKPSFCSYPLILNKRESCIAAGQDQDDLLTRIYGGCLSPH
jgi:hypothetical protein